MEQQNDDGEKKITSTPVRNRQSPCRRVNSTIGHKEEKKRTRLQASICVLD